MLVAINLTPIAFRDVEEGDDGHGIWPSHGDNRLRPCLWERLPFDILFDSVLVRLPLPTLLKLRCVSRSWRSRLSSGAFWILWFNGHREGEDASKAQNACNRNANFSLKLYHKNLVRNRSLSHTQSELNRSHHGNIFSQQGMEATLLNAYASNRPGIVPCILLRSFQGRKCVDDRAANWMKQKSISYRRSQLQPRTQKEPHDWLTLHENFLPTREPYNILACNKGLLLLARTGEDAQEFIVCNPLLRLHKVLPKPTFPFFQDISASGFITDIDHEKYTIILSSAGCEIFDSSVGQWQLAPPQNFANYKGVSPPMLYGSIFWLSQQTPSFHNTVVLSAYYATEKVVTCVHTRFPAQVRLPTCGYVWKDAQGLKTLALKDSWLGTWKLDADDGMWKQEKRVLSDNVPNWNVYDLHYVKVGNILLISHRYHSKVYVFNLELNKGCWTPASSNSEGATGLCVFEPSYVPV